ncbi:unnamed protein product [Meganyctiphanes norvegica]|uniref:Major facilitator superfamily (MFS) profile domain-containing protein n=1 Tax=Meganyctiphanes norvegica TaxID=48144 RepID=A0AAV2PVB0_MEGNR
MGPDERMPWWGARNTLSLMGFLGIAMAYATRVNLSIAIVAMVGKQVHEGGQTYEDACPMPDNHTESKMESVAGEFDWGEAIQGVVLSSFFWGYTATQMLGGRAAEYFGGKLVFGIGITVSSALALVSPVAARLDKSLFIAVRILQGLAQGVIFPSISTLLATWVPSAERSKYTANTFAGLNFGTILALLLGGWIADPETGLGGWPSVFYIFGGAGVVWGIVWFLIIHDRPEKHPRITQAELNQLQGNDMKSSERIAIPWRDLMTSRHVWCIIATSMGSSFGFYTILTELPSYLKNIQHFNIKKSGILSSLPYLCMWIGASMWGMIMSYLSQHDKIQLTTARKISTGLALLGPATGLVCMCFVNCHSTMAIIVLSVMLLVHGAVFSGYMCGPQDLAPNLAGTIYGVLNTAGAGMGILAPTITGAIIEGNQTLAAWRTVFLLASGAISSTCLIYLVFFRAEVQPWNQPKDKPSDEEAERLNK